jgi:protein TonB
VPPLKVIDVRPQYPEALKTAGIAGVVTLVAVIGTDGTVREVTVLSSPHPDLEKAAADAVRKWEFSTTYLNCTPIEVSMRVTVNFTTP